MLIVNVYNEIGHENCSEQGERIDLYLIVWEIRQQVNVVTK